MSITRELAEIVGPLADEMRKLAGGVRERGGSRGALTAKLRRPALEERRDAFAEILRAGRRHECVALGFELFVERYTRRLIVA